MVTIARSSLDGFTPGTVVEKLQADVLSIVQNVYCNDMPDRERSLYRLEVVRDYGQWEGSTIPDTVVLKAL